MSKILSKNPLLAFGLGSVLILGISHSLELAIIYGLILTVVMVISKLISKALEKLFGISNLLTNVMITSFFVILVSVLVRALNYGLFQELGIYLVLMLANGFLYDQQESKESLLGEVLQTFLNAVVILVIGAIIALVREFLGTGGYSFKHLFNGGFVLLPVNYVWNFMVGPVGAFITLGVTLAIYNIIRNRRLIKNSMKEAKEWEQSKLSH